MVTQEHMRWLDRGSRAVQLVCLILAGGLTTDNAAEAIGTVRPFGVDVASGVESSPGVKDHGKLRSFVQAAQTAFAEINR